jgi:lipoprotein-releasing system permease protein
MRTPFEWFVALRYLRGAQGRTGGTRFLRFVTFVGIGGVAVGVAALLLALMVVRGFSSEIEGVVLNGLPEGAPTFLRERLVDGTFELREEEGRQPGIVIGEGLANLLGVGVGDAVMGLASRESAQPLLGRPRVVGFVVEGIYETGLADFDRTFAYVGIGSARRLLGLADTEATRLEILLDDIAGAQATADRINVEPGLPLFARSIYQVQANLFAWVNLQQSIVPLVIGVIILVAAFNIIGLLLMVILEKTREIGILRSMGAGASAVRRLFVALGIVVGSVGTSLGLLLALAMGLLQDRFGIIPLPQEAYYIDTAPVELQALDFVLVAAVSLLLCAIASYVPARVAARVEPVRAIRFAG